MEMGRHLINVLSWRDCWSHAAERVGETSGVTAQWVSKSWMLSPWLRKSCWGFRSFMQMPKSNNSRIDVISRDWGKNRRTSNENLYDIQNKWSLQYVWIQKHLRIWIMWLSDMSLCVVGVLSPVILWQSCIRLLLMQTFPAALGSH